MKDYYSDQGHLFGAIFCNKTLPDYVRDAVESQKVAQLHDEGFADPLNRLFPVNTAHDTYVSAAYYGKQGGADPAILQKIAQSAEIFDITADVQDIQRYVAGLQQKLASPAEEVTRTPFEISLGLLDYPAVKGCGRAAIEKVATIITQRQRDFSTPVLMAAADSLLKVAAADGVTLPAIFQKLAGKTIATESAVREQKAIRLSLVTDPLKKKEAAAEMEKATSAPALAEFDDKFKLAGFYGKNVDDPISVFHTMPQEAAPSTLTEKIAADLKANGESGVAFAALSAALGKERADGLLKEGVSSLETTSLDLVTTYLSGAL